MNARKNTRTGLRTATLSYAAAVAIFGTIGWPYAYIALPSEIVVLVRALIAAAFIAVILLVAKRRFDTAAVRANARWLVLSGLFLGINWVLLFAAMRATTVAVASLCNYMAPVILIVVAPIVLHEKRSFRKLACAVVAVVGMMLVAGLFSGGSEGVTAEGVALGLGAAVAFAAMVLCNKKIAPMPVYERAIIQLLIGSAVALVVVVANGAENMAAIAAVDVRSVVLLIVVGLVHTGLAYFLYFTGMGELSAQSVGVLGYIEPALAVIVSAAILLQPLSVAGWVGAILVIGAAIASEVVE